MPTSRPARTGTNNTTHTKFPSFNPASYNAAMQELDAFFADMVVSGGTFKDLFTEHHRLRHARTPRAFTASPRTATTPTKMALDATKRPGFLTRVAFLSTFSHFDATEPDPSRRVHHRARPRRPGRRPRPGVPG